MPRAELSYSLGSWQELTRPGVRTTSCLILELEKNKWTHSTQVSCKKGR